MYSFSSLMKAVEARGRVGLRHLLAVLRGDNWGGVN